MKTLIIGVGIAMSAQALAQTVTIDGAAAYEAVKNQRNQQADIVAELVGRLATLQKELDTAKAAQCKPEKPEKK